MVQTLQLMNAVSFEPYPSDLNVWLSDKHFIVAGGIGDSQVEVLLAGMACGLKPIVHHFPGAENLFPARHLFNIAEQFCEQVLSQDYEPEQYRRFVEERCPIGEPLRRVNGILMQLETEIEARTGIVSAPGQSPSPGGRCQPPDCLAAGARGGGMPV
jgi:hypothetical protein